MKIVENFKNVGHAIANIYRRLGEEDCPANEENDILTSNTAEAAILRKSLNDVDLIENKYYSSNAGSSNKGGKGIVDKAKVDEAKAMEKAEQKVRVAEDREK